MYNNMNFDRERDNYVFIIEKKEEEDIPEIPLHHVDAKEAQKEDNGEAKMRAKSHSAITVSRIQERGKSDRSVEKEKASRLGTSRLLRD